MVEQVLKSNQKTILLVIYNSQNQRRYIGVKLDWFMDLKSKIILIYGPTASGKSKFAIDLANMFRYVNWLIFVRSFVFLYICIFWT